MPTARTIAMTALVLQAKTGDRAAAAEVIEMNARTLWRFAHRRANGSDMTADDFFQIGVIACMDAIQKFDPNGRANFNTFLHHWISGYTLRERRLSGIIKVPSRFKRDSPEYQSAQGILSIDYEYAEAETIGDSLPDYRTDSPDASICHRETLDRLRQAIASLPDKYRVLVEMRLQGHQWQPISEAVGFTKECARQRHLVAVELLRAALA